MIPLLQDILIDIFIMLNNYYPMSDSCELKKLNTMRLTESVSGSG